MKSNVTVTKILNLDGKETLLFDVYYINNIGDLIKIGNYEVNDNGALLGEIDIYISVYHKDSISKMQNVMLDSGLKAIVADDMPKNKIFDSKSSTCLNPNLFLIKNSKRWNRALNYLENNNIDIEELSIGSRLK